MHDRSWRMAGGAVALAAVALTGCDNGDPEPEGGAASAQGLDLARWEIVDLTHPFDERTVYWPTAPSGFRLDTLSYGEDEQGRFYSSFLLSGPEHGGTHVDAPLHFHDGGAAVDEVELSRLVAPAVVIDVASEAENDRDFQLRPRDIQEWEREHGRIPEGSVVLLRTGWDRFWPNTRQYLGDGGAPGAESDAPSAAPSAGPSAEAPPLDLHFPSFGPDAMRLLVEGRRIGAVGVDAASIDRGASRNFNAHRIAAAAGVPALENLRMLDRLPATGATVVALPMKIAGGSGAPTRVIALVPRD